MLSGANSVNSNYGSLARSAGWALCCLGELGSSYESDVSFVPNRLNHDFGGIMMIDFRGGDVFNYRLIKHFFTVFLHSITWNFVYLKVFLRFRSFHSFSGEDSSSSIRNLFEEGVTYSFYIFEFLNFVMMKSGLSSCQNHSPSIFFNLNEVAANPSVRFMTLYFLLSQHEPPLFQKMDAFLSSFIV
jgi:hypothetical protein